VANAVSFANAFFRDGALSQSLEDSTRLCAAYGGVHKFDFKDAIDEAFADLDDWTTDAGATAAISSGRLSLTGGGSASTWYQTVHDTRIPLGFVASFDWISSDGGGFFWNKNDDDKRCFMAWWSSGYVAFSALDSAGQTSNHFVIMPYGISAPARIQVQARYSLDTIDDDRKWMQGAIFVDGVCYAAFAYDIGETSLDWEGDGVGFAAYEAQNLLVDNFRISEMHRIVDWATVDIGNSPGSGMTQAIGTTRVRYMCRYDNTLKMWRPGNRSTDWTAEEGRALKEDTRKDINATTHVRVQAAIHEADGFDESGGMDRGHNFLLYNDPNIMTERESWFEAYRVLHDAKERAHVSRFILPPNYLIEPYDVISIDGVLWRVLSVNVHLGLVDRAPQPHMRLECQKYETMVDPVTRTRESYAYNDDTGTWQPIDWGV
jgi:hypothetical protein